MSGLISAATLERIRAASDIVDVITQVLPLKRAGANFVALCPFHKEKTPSFSVNPNKQIFYCFGCHKGGDVFRFVQEYENIGFVEAVRRLAERAGIPLELVTEPGERTAHFLKEALLKVHEQLTQQWHQILLNDPSASLARQYLASREVPTDAIRLFRLGYAPADWDHTIRWAGQQGLDLVTLEKAGLVVRKEGSDRYFGRFRDRLMFPICDEQGRVVAFSGRVLNPDAPGGKYVNSPETPIFSKGRIFYGLDKSKRAILEAQCAVLCEGQLDLIRCHLAGVQNTVAPQGTALTADHARILKRYANEVILCFDADNAGQNAADRSLDHLLAAGLAVRVAVMPSPHDPDSFIRKEGAAAFQDLIQRAPGFFDYFLDRCCRLHDPATDRGRLAISRAMAEAVWKTGHEVLVDTYAQKTAHRLAISPDAVRREFRQFSTAKRPVSEESLEAPSNEPDTAHLAPHELWLLRLLFLDDELANWLARYLDLDWISHPAVRHLVSLRTEAARENRWTGVAAFISQLTDPTEIQLVSMAVAEDRDIPNRQQQVADLVRRLRNQHLDRQLGELQRRLADPALPEADQLNLVLSQKTLRQAKSQPLQPLQRSES